MNLGIIAGNQLFPILLAQSVKEVDSSSKITAICFYGETNPLIRKYVDKTVWLHVGELEKLLQTIENERLKNMVMAGQINPRRIFRPSRWDRMMKKFVAEIEDFRPHTFFLKLINTLEEKGVKFLKSTVYMEKYLATEGIMNNIPLSPKTISDIEFGTEIISNFVELDIGQTIAVKNKAVVALEALEGTNLLIKRASRIAGDDVVILKFSKKNQDLRFDVPVVGIKTLRLLRKCGVHTLVLESKRVIILEKQKFLQEAKKFNISIVGKNKQEKR